MGWLTVWPRDMMWVNIAFFARIVSIELQDGEESLLGHFHVTYLLHALLSFLLLFEQLALTAHVAAIALGLRTCFTVSRATILAPIAA